MKAAFSASLLESRNPLETLSLVADPEPNLNLMMKDGKIFKNTLT